MRDLDSGNSKGFGFVSFDSFESADLAIECMNGQFLSGRQVSIVLELNCMGMFACDLCLIK